MPLAEVDLRAGGSYRIHMLSPEGKLNRLYGTYREVKPPERLVYTWNWAEDPEMGETLVTVEFHQQGESTKILLTHEFFPDAGRKDLHVQGWNGCLDHLTSCLQPSI